MLSYRHAFHAGNHADVLKHAIVVQLLEQLSQKDKPFWYIDTHAGAGLYALELSRELHGHCRAGQLFCDLALPLAKNVNVIDASIFRCDFFGHSYWDASPTVEHDLGVLLSQGVMSNDPPGTPRTPQLSRGTSPRPRT